MFTSRAAYKDVTFAKRKSGCPGASDFDAKDHDHGAGGERADFCGFVAVVKLCIQPHLLIP